MSRKLITALTFVLAVAVAPVAALAGTVELVDGTKMSGEVVHAFRGQYTIKTSEGEVVIPQKKIKRITFEKLAARAVYSSPEKTLEAWRSAAVSGDTEAMIEAYALMYQGMVAQQMAELDFKARSQLIADVSDTKFEIKEKKIEKNRAVLTVAQSKGGETRDGELRFVKEAGEWKMTP